VKGTIKFIDQRTANSWGYIVPEDGSRDVHFYASDADGAVPSSADAGAPVEYFDLEDGPRGPHARKFRLLVATAEAPYSVRSVPGDELTAWAFVPYIPFRSRDGDEYSSVLEYLARLALPEKWHFGTEPDPRAPFPILDNYLTYTFVKLRRENKVLEADNWAAFNTGLVDRLYDPIYTLFNRNDRVGAAPWHFYDFCVPGKRASGRMLTGVFDPLPEPAKYFNSNFDMIFDTSKEIYVDYEHVIVDGSLSPRILEGASS
jgi:cold shock CspA family protein